MSQKTSVSVVWQPMNGAASYDINVDGTLVQNISETKYIHTGLESGSQHTYKVRAVNETGTSDWSMEITVVTVPESPAIHSNIAVSSTTSKVLVSWNQVSNANGYEIEVDGVVADNGTGNSYLHSGLSPDTQHKYRVRAKNAGNIYSAWSDLLTVNTKSSTMTYAVNCTAGEELNLVFSAADVQELGQYTFTITYNPYELEVADLCAATSKIDIATGYIAGTDIQIIQYEPGTILLKKTGSAGSYEVWSGTVNMIRFISRIDGQSNVIYSFQ